MWNGCDGAKVNRFSNLDGLEDRIIYYLLSPNNKSEQELELTHTIWKLLCYDTSDALLKETPKYADVVNLICNGDDGWTGKRIFRSPHMDDAWLEQSTLLKVYVSGILPMDVYRAQVNIGIDIVTHVKTINVTTPEDDVTTFIEEVDGIKVRVQTKNRVTLLTRCVLALLNGKEIQGVGIMQFNYNSDYRYNEAQYGLWNNRNFEGMKIVIGCQVTGVA